MVELNRSKEIHSKIYLWNDDDIENVFSRIQLLVSKAITRAYRFPTENQPNESIDDGSYSLTDQIEESVDETLKFKEIRHTNENEIERKRIRSSKNGKNKRKDNFINQIYWTTTKNYDKKFNSNDQIISIDNDRRNLIEQQRRQFMSVVEGRRTAKNELRRKQEKKSKDSSEIPSIHHHIRSGRCIVERTKFDDTSPPSMSSSSDDIRTESNYCSNLPLKCDMGKELKNSHVKTTTIITTATKNTTTTKTTTTTTRTTSTNKLSNATNLYNTYDFYKNYKTTNTNKDRNEQTLSVQSIYGRLVTSLGRRTFEVPKEYERKLKLVPFHIGSSFDRKNVRSKNSKNKKKLLGVTLETNIDYGVNGCRIKSINKNGLVGVDGRLNVGDFIVRVNNEHLRCISPIMLKFIMGRADLLSGDVHIVYIKETDVARAKQDYLVNRTRKRWYESDMNLDETYSMNDRIDSKDEYYNGIFSNKYSSNKKKKDLHSSQPLPILPNENDYRENHKIIENDLVISSDRPNYRQFATTANTPISGRKYKFNEMNDSDIILHYQDEMNNNIDDYRKDIYDEDNDCSLMNDDGKNNYYKYQSTPELNFNENPLTSSNNMSLVNTKEKSNEIIKFSNPHHKQSNVMKSNSTKLERKQIKSEVPRPTKSILKYDDKNRGIYKQNSFQYHRPLPQSCEKLNEEKTDKQTNLPSNLCTQQTGYSVGGRTLTANTTSKARMFIENLWGEERHVYLNRMKNRSLGISIVGGRIDSDNELDKIISGIFVKNVLTDSPAAQFSLLKTGDRILMVNDISIRNASHERAVEIIQKADSPVDFVVQSLVDQDLLHEREKLEIFSKRENHENCSTESILSSSITSNNGSKDKGKFWRNIDILCSENDELLSMSDIPSLNDETFLDKNYHMKPDGKLSDDDNDDGLGRRTRSSSLSSSVSTLPETDNIKVEETSEIIKKFQTFVIKRETPNQLLGMTLKCLKVKSNDEFFNYNNKKIGGNVSDSQCVVVAIVEDGCVARQTTMEVYDIIHKINDINVNGRSHLEISNLIRTQPFADGNIDIVIERNNKILPSYLDHQNKIEQTINVENRIRLSNHQKKKKDVGKDGRYALNSLLTKPITNTVHDDDDADESSKYPSKQINGNHSNDENFERFPKNLHRENDSKIGNRKESSVPSASSNEIEFEETETKTKNFPKEQFPNNEDNVKKNNNNDDNDDDLSVEKCSKKSSMHSNHSSLEYPNDISKKNDHNLVVDDEVVGIRKKVNVLDEEVDERNYDNYSLNHNPFVSDKFNNRHEDKNDGIEAISEEDISINKFLDNYPILNIPIEKSNLTNSFGLSILPLYQLSSKSNDQMRNDGEEDLMRQDDGSNSYQTYLSEDNKNQQDDVVVGKEIHINARNTVSKNQGQNPIHNYQKLAETIHSNNCQMNEWKLIGLLITSIRRNSSNYRLTDLKRKQIDLEKNSVTGITSAITTTNNNEMLDIKDDDDDVQKKTMRNNISEYSSKNDECAEENDIVIKVDKMKVEGNSYTSLMKYLQDVRQGVTTIFTIHRPSRGETTQLFGRSTHLPTNSNNLLKRSESLTSISTIIATQTHSLQQPQLDKSDENEASSTNIEKFIKKPSIDYQRRCASELPMKRTIFNRNDKLLNDKRIDWNGNLINNATQSPLSYLPNNIDKQTMSTQQQPSTTSSTKLLKKSIQHNSPSIIKSSTRTTTTTVMTSNPFIDSSLTPVNLMTTLPNLTKTTTVPLQFAPNHKSFSKNTTRKSIDDQDDLKLSITRSEILPDELSKIYEFDSTDSPFGLTLIGSIETLFNKVIVLFIEKNGRFGDGRLLPGDEVLRLNERNVDRLTIDEISQEIIQSSEKNEKISMKIRKLSPVQKQMLYNCDPSIFEIVHIELVKRNGKGFGFSISGHFNRPTSNEMMIMDERFGVYVTHLMSSGPAEHDGRLRIYDRLMSLNGKNISNLSCEMISSLLRTSQNKIVLSVARFRRKKNFDQFKHTHNTSTLINHATSIAPSHLMMSTTSTLSSSIVNALSGSLKHKLSSNSSMSTAHQSLK
ncbi:hypothetical protein SNEBB_005913 [Seison nebaliae]|nr:hypothetical protein SNEBB_005913 [Seison nebaliae]